MLPIVYNESDNEGGDRVRVRIEIDPRGEEEIVIRAKEISDKLQALQSSLEREWNASEEIALRRGEEECYLPYREILFFATEGKNVVAHTKNDDFLCPLHLKELLLLLPRSFARASKSCIVNTACICSIQRSPTGVSTARFTGSNKLLYISRMYYKIVREIIEETRLK